MPIRASERARYPKDWPQISRRIREREGNRCAWCGAPSGVEIKRRYDDPEKWITVADFVQQLIAARTERERLSLACQWRAPIRVVLTVAHKDHVPEHCDDDNLVALCQRCHLTYDAKHHAKNAAVTRAERRDDRTGQVALIPHRRNA